MGDIPEYYMDKLYAMPARFTELYLSGDYARAAYVYRKALVIAVFLELPREQMSELFGQWPEDVEDPPDGLFKVEWVRKADWECCIRQHKTYQDEACRRAGEPPRYYSDGDFCALHCHGAAGAGRVWQTDRRRA